MFVICEISAKHKLSWLDVEVLDGALDATRMLINSEEGAHTLLSIEGGLDSIVGLLQRSAKEGGEAKFPFSFIRRHTPFSPYVAPRFPQMSEMNSLFSIF